MNDLGRHVFGASAFGLGIVGLLWHDFNDWQQLHSLWSGPYGPVMVYVAAVCQLAGGIAIQTRSTERLGATLLGAVYLFFALRWVPQIVAQPLVFDRWGNVFEQLSLVAGALIVYASAAPTLTWAAKGWQTGRILFGICVVSFTLAQVIYLAETAAFVPKWVPPSQMFWAVTTTIALALAAVAILSGRSALLASQLLTVMFMIFGLLVWLPRVIVDPHLHMNWGGNGENLAITAAAWIVADCLRREYARSGAAQVAFSH
jgi:hypothetical protein